MTICVAAFAIAFASLPPAGQNATFPKIVKGKTLYATKDLRGKRAPKFVVEKFLGTAPNTKGKVVVIDFWATWCGPCVALIPEINAWHRRLSKDVVFIGLSDEPQSTVASFLRKTPIAYSVGIDTKARMKRAIGIQGIPHVLVIDRKGIVRWQGFPGSPEDKLTEKIIRQIVSASKR